MAKKILLILTIVLVITVVVGGQLVWEQKQKQAMKRGGAAESELIRPILFSDPFLTN